MEIPLRALLDHYNPECNPVTAEWHVSYLMVQALSGPWQVSIPLEVKSAMRDRDTAIAYMKRFYPSGAVQVVLGAFDHGIQRDRQSQPFQRVVMTAIFEDTNDWRVPGAENLVGQAMAELEAAVSAISGNPGPTWRRG
jgi:hypothetical protein